MSKLARAPAYVAPLTTNANRLAAAEAEESRKSKDQLIRNAEAWNEPRRKAAYAAVFQQKYGRPQRTSGLNYTLGEHEYASWPPGVASSNQLVNMYKASKKTRKNRRSKSRKARKNTRRSN